MVLPFGYNQKPKPKYAMKTLFHVTYHRGDDRTWTRQEYATSYNEAKRQALEYFKMFGYGDEVIIYVDKF